MPTCARTACLLDVPSRAARATDPGPDPVTDLLGGLRAPAFAASSLGLSVTGHVLAGGVVPDPLWLTLLAVLVAVSHRVLARRELSLLRLALGVGGAQVLLHLALAGGAAHPVGHGHDVAGGMPMAGTPSAGMLAVHALAALLTAVWLRRGERAFWRLARRLLCAVIRGRRSPAPIPQRVLRPDRWLRPVIAPSLIALVADPRRGPPLHA